MRDMLDGKIQTHSMEKRYFRKDGSIVWVDLTVSLVRDPSGQPKYFIAVIEDIDARKRAESERQRLYAFLESIVENIPDMVFVKDAKSLEYLLLNRAAAEILGPRRTELIGKNDYDLLPKEVADSFTEKDHAALHNKTLLDIPEELIKSAHHGERILHTKKIPILDDQGEPAYLLGISEDITERKHADEALKLHGTIVDTMSEGVCLIRASDAAIIYANRRFETIFGYGPGELDGRPVATLNASGEQSAEAGAQEIQRALRKNGAWRGEVRNRKKDGTPFWCQSSVSTFQHSQHGDIWVAVHTDITKRKHAEETRQRHEREMMTINNILRAINTHLDVKAAFPEVCAGLRELARCAAVSLNLFDERREWLTFVAADGPWALGAGQDVRLGAAEFPAITDVLAGRPHIVRDLATELQFPLVRVVYEIGFRSVVSLPLCVGSDVVGFLDLFWREVDGCQAGEMGLLTQVTNPVALAVERNRLFEQVSAGRERLAVLFRRFMEVQEAERRHLARELHDEIGQYLTGVSLVLDGLQGRPLNSASALLGEAHQLVDDLIVRVRDLSLDLRPAMLDDLGLLPALLWLFERFSKQTNVKIEFRHSGLNRRFQHEVETAAYRIVQEALTNVARHAGVSKARVYVSADHRLLSVLIADHGKGFDPDAVLGAGATGGFLGMRERAGFAGGRLSVESGVGTGTRVRAEFKFTGQIPSPCKRIEVLGTTPLGEPSRHSGEIR